MIDTYYIHWFSYLPALLCLWYRTHLIVLHDPSDVLLFSNIWQEFLHLCLTEWLLHGFLLHVLLYYWIYRMRLEVCFVYHFFTLDWEWMTRFQRLVQLKNEIIQPWYCGLFCITFFLTGLGWSLELRTQTKPPTCMSGNQPLKLSLAASPDPH